MNGWLKNFHWQEAALPVFATLSVLALLFRLPPGVMDLLLSINLALSTVVFLSTFFIRKPLDFSVFPTILLTTTLYRLVLNVSTTRLILTEGNAGKVIDAFSRFVAGDDIVVGAVVFLIFVIIQFVVITKGATRISEVSARFALDALPGRQSAIDFDLNAGNISDKEAQEARAELAEQADFFGAMDGASKFVRGDAIAGLAIVFINVVGGLCIGVAHGRSLGAAVELYSKLTIGDGLVSQVPAFLISLATGLLVARTSRSQSVSATALSQTFGRPIVLVVTGVFLVFLAFTGLPLLPLLTLACGCFALAWGVGRQLEQSAQTSSTGSVVRPTTNKGVKGNQADEDDVEQFLAVEPTALEIGVGLIQIAQPEDGPSLLERVRRVRQEIASELGVVLPKVNIRDSAALDDNQFVIKINGEEVASGFVYPQMTLAVENGVVFGGVRGLQTTAPSLGTSAYWIDEATKEEASALGYELWSPGDFIEKKTLETTRREAAALLSRDATKRLIERLRETSPTLVEEALGAESEKGANARLAFVQQTLQALLRERVSIRRLDRILEALGDLSLREPNANVYRALDFVRSRLARTIASQYRDEDGVLRVAMLEPTAEDALREKLQTNASGAPTFALAPSEVARLTSALREAANALREADAKPVVLIDGALRYALREAAASLADNVAFLAFDEVDPSTKISQEVVVDWTLA